MPAPILTVDGVSKRFDGHVAVDALSLALPAGGIHGLLGPNGAGKSTTIRMLMSILVPDEGRITIFGQPASRTLDDRIGFLPEERGLYRKMDVLEHLVFFGEVKGLRRRDARTRAERWLERLGLGAWAGRKVEELSKGMQQKVQFAGALLHDPELVVLDEPFSGLDPVNAQVMKEIVIELARDGRTVLLSTHIMEQAEKMCDRVTIIARGRKLADGPINEVRRGDGSRHVALAFHRGAESAAGVLRDPALVARLDDHGATAELELAPGADADELLRRLVATGVGLSRFEVVEPSLQSVFFRLVGNEAATVPALAPGRTPAGEEVSVA